MLLLRAPDGIEGERFLQRARRLKMSSLLDLEIEVAADDKPYVAINGTTSHRGGADRRTRAPSVELFT